MVMMAMGFVTDSGSRRYEKDVKVERWLDRER